MKRQIFDPWTNVDVIDSPRLTGFIGCMMLELSDKIEALDLSAPDNEEDRQDVTLVSTYNY